MAKIVYSSASEVAHLWANKAQDHARYRHTFSFDGEYVYSYRTKIGKYSHNTNFVLLNKNNYSNTTAKHQREVASAVYYKKVVNINCNCFHSSYQDPFRVGNVIKAFEHDYERIAGKLAKATKPQKYIADFYTLLNEIAAYNDYLKACRDLELTGEDEYASEEQFEELYEVYTTIRNIVDGSEVKEAKQKYFARKEAKEQARKERLREEFLNSIKAWKVHLRDEEGNLITIKHKEAFAGESDFVRLSSDGLFFETHRGAKVKKSEGLALFRILTVFTTTENHSVSLPMSIGSYTLEYIKPNGDCKIGCHKFTYEEFASVYKTLKAKDTQKNETLKIN